MKGKTRLIDFGLLIVFLLFAGTAWAGDAVKNQKVLLGMGETVNLNDAEVQVLLKLADLSLKERKCTTEIVRFASTSNEHLLKLRNSHGAGRVVVIDAIRAGDKLVVLIRSTEADVFRHNSLQLNSIDEYPTAIARIVDALLSKRSYTETAGMQTLVGRETHAPGKRPGEFLWGVGINVGSTMNVAVAPRYGVSLKAAYLMQNWRIESGLSYLGSEGEGGETSSLLTEWNLGVGYSFGERNWAPFVSAGLGIIHQALSDLPRESNYDYTQPDHDNDTGLGLYLGGGLEFFRFHNTRLLAGLRVILPTFTLNLNGEETWAPTVKTNLSFVF
ncbi:MAG TPA: hypothetical protein EYN06_05750 [Myxococcales bacterium]|nr:hypothetical protein [Myxococcales bacterium]HIN85967.1 hypothetical protein [Myxococcales bacterium]